MFGIDLGLTAGGLLTGLLVGLTGMGGAALMTPMLVLLFGVSPAAAVSADVVATAIMKPVGAWVHIRAKTVHWGLVLWLSVGSIPGVILGTVFFIHVLGSDEAGEIIRTWIGWVLIAAVAAMVIKTWVGRRAAGLRADHAPQGTRMPVKPVPTVVLGLIVGLLVGMTSVGSGSLVVTVLLLLYPLLRPSILVGTDLTQAVPMLVVGAIAHAGFGDFSIMIVISLLLGQIPGIWLGARMSSRYDGTALRYLLMVLLAATAVKLLGAPTLIAGMIGAVGLIVVGAIYVRERIHAQAEVSAAPADGGPERRSSVEVP